MRALEGSKCMRVSGKQISFIEWSTKDSAQDILYGGVVVISNSGGLQSSPLLLQDKLWNNYMDSLFSLVLV